MNRTLVDRLVAAVLYEGYMLYPYRPSVKSRQRWTFGGLCPEAYCQAHPGAETASCQTECLIEGNEAATVDIVVRFLHLTERRVGKLAPPLAAWSPTVEPAYATVESFQIGDRQFHPWQEAEERAITLDDLALGDLTKQGQRWDIAIAGRRWLEPLADSAGQVVGVLVREQRSLQGRVEASARAVDAGLFQLTVRVLNTTHLDDVACQSRDQALLHGFVSTHTIVTVHDGAFVSLIDPPEPCRAAAAGCRNIGTWPVLVGDPGQRDTLLSSPVILYDYPQLAPESPGDLFDSTEIDEILTLRILTLTEEEKRQAAALDEYTRALLARTEALTREQLLDLHGTLRSLRPASTEKSHD